MPDVPPLPPLSLNDFPAPSGESVFYTSRTGSTRHGDPDCAWLQRSEPREIQGVFPEVATLADYDLPHSHCYGPLSLDPASVLNDARGVISDRNHAIKVLAVSGDRDVAWAIRLGQLDGFLNGAHQSSHAHHARTLEVMRAARERVAGEVNGNTRWWHPRREHDELIALLLPEVVREGYGHRRTVSGSSDRTERLYNAFVQCGARATQAVDETVMNEWGRARFNATYGHVIRAWEENWPRLWLENAHSPKELADAWTEWEFRYQNQWGRTITDEETAHMRRAWTAACAAWASFMDGLRADQATPTAILAGGVRWINRALGWHLPLAGPMAAAYPSRQLTIHETRFGDARDETCVIIAVPDILVELVRPDRDSTFVHRFGNLSPLDLGQDELDRLCHGLTDGLSWVQVRQQLDRNVSTIGILT
jgi:hypothetical protein